MSWDPKIKDRLEQCKAAIVNLEAAATKAKSRTAAATTPVRNFGAAVAARKSDSAPLRLLSDNVRETLAAAADLGHETELLLDTDALLTEAGLDLSALFDEDQLGDQLPWGVRLSQSADAEVSGHPNYGASQGELALAVPLSLEVFGQTRAITLIVIAQFSFGGSSRLGGRRSRAVEVDAKGLDPEIRDAIRVAATAELDRFFPVIPRALPSIGLGLPASFYCAEFDPGAGLRVFGTVGGRVRSKTGRIPNTLDWADAAFKLRSTVFTRQVQARIRAAGAQPGALGFPGGNRFRTTAVATRTKTIRLGCTDVTGGVKLTAFVEGTTRVRGRSFVQISIAEYRDADIAYIPELIRPLLGWIGQVIKEVIRRLAPAINYNVEYRVPGCEKLAVGLDSHHLMLHMKRI